MHIYIYILFLYIYVLFLARVLLLCLELGILVSWPLKYRPNSIMALQSGEGLNLSCLLRKLRQEDFKFKARLGL